MKSLLTIYITTYCLSASGQLSLERAQEASRQFHLSSYSYHEAFIGHTGYGAPLILTADGGAAQAP
ncbi:MAG: hypothetical protein JNN04_01615 [Cyclobacteriaceae bacterium]|nr:hypothetical protein [Cyclobacteriaceae bacterium]